MVKRQFGLEFESYGLTANILKGIMGTAGVGWKDNLWTHNGQVYFNRKTWQGMADGSIAGRGSHGQSLSYPYQRENYANKEITHEVVTPVLKGGKGMKDVQKVLKGMNKAGAKADNSSMGLHVTFGLDNTRWQRMGRKKRAKSLARIVDTYNYFGPAINTMVAKSRRGSGFASFNNLQQSLRSKYSAVNLKQFEDGGRVEFRQHQGTLSFKKTREWVNFLDRLLNFSTNEEFKDKNPTDYPRTFEGMSEALGLNPAQIKYWNKRRAKLNPYAGVRSGVPLPPTGEGFLGFTSEGEPNRGILPEGYVDNTGLDRVPTSSSQVGLTGINPDWPKIMDFQRRHGRID